MLVIVAAIVIIIVLLRRTKVLLTLKVSIFNVHRVQQRCVGHFDVISFDFPYKIASKYCATNLMGECMVVF